MTTPENILFIKLGSIGDIVLTIPALEMIKKKYPSARLDYMVSESCETLVRRIRCVDGVVVTPNLGAGTSMSQRVSDFAIAVKLAYSLRAKNYDVVVNTLRNPVFAFMCYVAGINEIITFTGGQLDPFSTKKVSFDLGKHHMERIFDLVEVMGVPRGTGLTPGGIDIRREDIDRANKLLGREDPDAPGLMVSSSPGGGNNPWTDMPSKRWEAGRFSRLYELLQRDFDARIVLLGSGPDARRVDTIQRETKANVLNLVGKATLAETMAILKMSRLYVGNDSGPLFLAAALGTPTLAIFGPTDASLINPPGGLNVAVQSPTDCSPCYNPLNGLKGMAFRCADYKCMEEISVEDVFRAVSALITESKQKSNM